MAEISNSKNRSPLAEATNRINASTTTVDPQGQKPLLQVNSAPIGTHIAHSSSATGNGSRSEDHTASNPPPPTVLKPPHEDGQSKRLSQASYESNSSGRSKRNYKTHIGPWQLGKTLGKGSSARVRLCRHNITNQLAAVKIVNRRMAYLVQDSSLAALSKWDSSMPERVDGEIRVPMAIEREVAILKLIEHPHIMKIYDIWENRSEIYLILEYIDQGDLFTFINSRGRLIEEVALYFFRQIISAITYCHSFNICHRDLKPENILITADYQIKIADFGMAALHQTDTHRLATACGSPHYAAPELLKNRQYRGDKADIWSMGVILYAMLAATLPFDDPDIRVMMNKTKKGQYEMPKYLSPEAEDLIRRMLQVNPDRRISLTEIWRHPLVQKYKYLDNYGDNNGQPPDIRKGFQHNPVAKDQIDPQLLRQLRSMWHMFSEHDLTLKLTCDEPNDQKAFYWLLFNYREKQLEDFKPELSPSTSDYHHLKPGVWKKRVSTCEFSQPRADGHGHSVSRFTVISTAAETEADTIQSYDPYRGSRVFQPLSSEVSHAKITVHRDRSSSSGGSQAQQAARARSGSSARPGRPGSSQGTMPARPPSSRGSLTSVQSGRKGTPQARKPSLRHKRGVDFTQARRQSNSVHAARRESVQMSTGSLQVDQRAGARSVSPDLPMSANGTYPMAKGAPEPMVKAKDPESVFTEEELRHFSSNIAKDCDEAFKSSLIEAESIAGSLCDADRKQRDSPLTFSMENSPTMTPATEMSLKTWDSRPLPPLPSEKTLHSPPVMSPKTQNSSFTTLADMDDVEHVAQIAVPIRVGKYADRRVMSAPIQTHSSRRLGTMPPINENTAVNVVSNDKSRIVSAPPHTPPKRFNGQARGIEYLSRVENSIRVVDSPGGPSPVRIPKPLNIQKRSAVKEGAPRNADDAHPNGAEHDGDGVSGHNGEGEMNTMRKKKSWFSRSSKAQSDSGTRSLRGSHDQLTLVGSDADEGDIAPGGIATKKKSFTLPFLKKSRSPELRMSIADDDPTESREVLNSKAVKNRETKRSSNASSYRSIEVKQNWFARLFRVKPATSYLCMTISRKRARQEIAILLREWKKYGIRGIQVDKQRNIVFAQVGAKNCLNLKEVAFAAEMMTVIEHGKKQPLSIIRFTQERGAASSFHQVVGTMKVIFDSRNLLVIDRSKQKMMIKTLNS